MTAADNARTPAPFTASQALEQQRLADLLHLATSSRHRSAASAADLTKPPLRPGADFGLRYPSRMGNRLHYVDGRVTDMQGAALSRTANGHSFTTYRQGTP